MDFDENDDDEDKKTTKGPKFPIQMYISEGNKYFRLGKFNLAIEFFNKGLEKDPTNEKCLIGRSKCYLRLAKYSEAKEDAETVLKTHKKSCDAKMLIGEADYFLGDFEKAFLTFYEGHQFRSNRNDLRRGHQMCRKTIDNSLNPDMPIVIDDEDIENVYKLEDSLNVDQRSKNKVRQDQYLEDLNFVNSLLQDDTIKSVHPDCEYIKEYLTDRQMFWRTQNPKTSKKSENDSVVKEVVDELLNSIHELGVIDKGVKIKSEDNIQESDLIDKKIEEISKDTSHVFDVFEEKSKDNIHESDLVDKKVEETPKDTSHLFDVFEEKSKDNTHSSDFEEQKPKDNSHTSDLVKMKPKNNGHASDLIEEKPKDNSRMSDLVEEKVEGETKDNIQASD